MEEGYPIQAVDHSAYAQAAADVFNGPNGRSALLVVGGLFGLQLILECALHVLEIVGSRQAVR